MTALFENRAEAGRELSVLLRKASLPPPLLVLALPRGGVPVGYEIAAALRVPLDVFVIRKLGVPSHPELALGAVAPGGLRVLNNEVIQSFAISEEEIELIAASETIELQRRLALYRGTAGEAEIAQRTVILADDGLATGATMRAAIKAIRLANPAHLAVAVPVSAPSTAELIRKEVDDFFCVAAPKSFESVGQWYHDFRQTTDDEVRSLVEQARADRRQ